MFYFAWDSVLEVACRCFVIIVSKTAVEAEVFELGDSFNGVQIGGRNWVRVAINKEMRVG